MQYLLQTQISTIPPTFNIQGIITCGSVVNDETNATDNWHYYTLNNPIQNQTMIISSCYNTTFYDSDLYLYDSNGLQLERNDYISGTECVDDFHGRLRLTDLDQGTYTVAITGWSSTYFGTYKLSVSCVDSLPTPEPTPSPTFNLQGSVNCGSLINGETTSIDNEHYYSFNNPTPNNTVVISTCYNETFRDSDLFLYDSTQSLITSNDIGVGTECDALGDFHGKLILTNLAQGDYTIGLTGFLSSYFGTYTMSVSCGGTSGWRAETCRVDSIDDSVTCGAGGLGNYYEYNIRPLNCDKNYAECVYDDSNGGTDCEYTATHSVGETRPCWVYYEYGVCQQCSCTNCDDSSRGIDP